VLLEQEIRDAGDDAGFVAPDDGDGGEMFHLLATNKHDRTQILKVFEGMAVKSGAVLWLLPPGTSHQSARCLFLLFFQRPAITLFA
jgi:hypothetical protein